MVHYADTRLGQQRVSLNVNLIVEFLQEITDKQYSGNIEPNSAIWKYTQKIELLFTIYVNVEYVDCLPFNDWFCDNYASIDEYLFLEWEFN